MKKKLKEPALSAANFPELDETADLIGDFIQYWGFKKIHGRIWAYLFLSEAPLHTRQLMELLGISKALVSISLAELLHYDVIEEAGKGRNGVLLYRANPNVGSVIAGVLRDREKKLLGSILVSVKKTARATPKKRSVRVADQKMEQLADWVKLANSFLETGVEYLGQFKS